MENIITKYTSSTNSTGPISYFFLFNYFYAYQLYMCIPFFKNQYVSDTVEVLLDSTLIISWLPRDTHCYEFDVNPCRSFIFK